VWVTCYTDASFSRRHGGAWAVWLRSTKGRIVQSGVCPSYVKDSNVAELAAIFAGVYIAIRSWGSQVRGIFVRSDSVVALAWVDPQAPLGRLRATRRLQRKLRELLASAGVELSCRHARGHRPRNESTSAFLNAHCDRLARDARLRRPRATSA
jgi:ribonuclease HI